METYMKSMTGYGKGEASHNGKSVKVELKAVNHRFLDLNIKLPRALNFLDEAIRKNIQLVANRGHIDVFVTFGNETEDIGDYKINMSLAKAYMTSTSTLGAELCIENDLKLSDIVKVPDVLERKESDTDEETLKTLVVLSTVSALAGLEEMRIAEGKQIEKDMQSKLDNLKKIVANIEKKAPLVVKDYKEKLKNRLKDLDCNLALDDSRLLTEISIFADKCAVDEEITRLYAHIAHFEEIFESDGPIGRKMDFLVQELNREANTIGSKANDLEITNNVLLLKNEIEKIREQAANIE